MAWENNYKRNDRIVQKRQRASECECAVCAESAIRFVRTVFQAIHSDFHRPYRLKLVVVSWCYWWWWWRWWWWWLTLFIRSLTRSLAHLHAHDQTVIELYSEYTQSRAQTHSYLKQKRCKENNREIEEQQKQEKKNWYRYWAYVREENSQRKPWAWKSEQTNERTIIKKREKCSAHCIECWSDQTKYERVHERIECYTFANTHMRKERDSKYPSERLSRLFCNRQNFYSNFLINFELDIFILPKVALALI